MELCSLSLPISQIANKRVNIDLAALKKKKSYAICEAELFFLYSSSVLDEKEVRVRAMGAVLETNSKEPE